MSKEKTYLKWYNKVGYGSGDVAGNIVYALLTSFIMIYLTDTIGLNAGVIGVLIAVSKIFDGITDIIFGTLIDKTHTKMGKAKPWSASLPKPAHHCLSWQCSVVPLSLPCMVG